MGVVDGRLAGHLREYARGFDAVRGERYSSVTVARDRFVVTVCRMNLAQVLGDETGAKSVSRDQSERVGEDFQAAKRRKFVQHQQELMFVIGGGFSVAVVHCGR